MTSLYTFLAPVDSEFKPSRLASMALVDTLPSNYWCTEQHYSQMILSYQLAQQSHRTRNHARLLRRNYMRVQNHNPAAWLAWHWLTPFHPITGALSTITAKGLSRTVSLKGGFTFVCLS